MPVPLPLNSHAIASFIHAIQGCAITIALHVIAPATPDDVIGPLTRKLIFSKLRNGPFGERFGLDLIIRDHKTAKATILLFYSIYLRKN